MANYSLTFSTNKDPIYKTINNAKEFIKMVAFQLTSEKIIELLKKRANEGIKIEIITLPTDSFKKVEERQIIETYYDELRKNNINLEICDWEVGDPSLTDTSQSGRLAEGGGQKWYSLHGKFIITDHNALILSANLIDADLWDVYLSIYDKKMKLYIENGLNRIKELFIESSEESKEIKGKLFDNIPNEIQVEIEDQWKANYRKNVKAYPSAISPINEITPGLKICPFDGRARNFLNKLINDSKEFLYISTERIFDEGFIELLKNKVTNSNIKVKILTGPPKKVRQSILKAEKQVLQLLAFEVDVRLLDNIHAKFWLSEKWLMVGSCNLTKMNLGFQKTGDLWRSNTETLFFSVT